MSETTSEPPCPASAPAPAIPVRALWEAALSSLADAVLIVDLEGRLVDFNDAFVRMTRFDSREECTRTLSAYPELLDVRTLDGQPVPPEQWPAARALRGETGQSVDLLVRRRTGGERWFASVSFSPIRDGRGALLGAVVAARDVTALKKYRAELENSRAALRKLVSRMDRAQEHERRHIAAELHDDLQQLLGAIAVEAIPAAGDNLADLKARMARVQALTAQGLESVRRIVQGLRPAALDQLGLPAALRALVGEFEHRSGLPAEFELLDGDGSPENLPARVTTALYRIAQEALQNVRKHARAQHTMVLLDCSDPNLVVLEVRDDGVGLPPADAPPSAEDNGRFGVLGMRERLLALGGTLDIGPADGGGTRLVARVPAGH